MVSMTHGGLQPSWTVKGTTFLLWGLAALCVVYWALKLIATPTAVAAAPPLLRTPAPVDTVAVSRLLGGNPAAAAATAAPSLASRFALQGVVADRQGAGAALIVVDGKPARPFRVGAQVEEGLVLQSLQGRRALLGPQRDGPTTLELELPARPTGR